MCSAFLRAGRSAVSLSSSAAAQKGNGVGKGFGFDSMRVELNWKVEKLLGGWMEQCRAVVAGPRELDLAGHGGRREEEEGGEATRRWGSGVLIGQRAPGRGEWRLGEVDLVRDDSTAGWRSKQRRCAWRGGVAARECLRDAC